MNNKQRQEYASLLNKLSSASPILMETIEYPQEKVDGPPFSISAAEVGENFSQRKIQVLKEDSSEPIRNQRFVDAGLTQVHLRVFCIK